MQVTPHFREMRLENQIEQPLIFMYSDQMLEDIASFCCEDVTKENKAQALGFDLLSVSEASGTCISGFVYR